MSESGHGVRDVCELTLHTADPTALSRFYIDVLGLEILQQQPDRVWLRCGEHTRLGLQRPEGSDLSALGAGNVRFALRVSPGALDEMAERVRTAGAELEGPVAHECGDRSLRFEDPAGNVVELWDFHEHATGARGVVLLRAA